MNAKEIVLRYFELTFNRHLPALADLRFLHPEYRHLGEGGQGRLEFVQFFEHHFALYPRFSSVVENCVVEKDLVVLHVQSKHSPDERAHAVAEFYRIKEDRIFEHWHVVGTA